MVSRQEWAELQSAADRAYVQRCVRKDGWAAILWGAVMALVGFGLHAGVPVGTLGAVLVLAGTWQVATPHPRMFLVNAALLALVGTLDILGVFVGLQSDRAPYPVLAMAGIVQCAWAVRLYQRHRRFAPGFQQELDPWIRQAADKVLEKLRREDPHLANDVIEFTTQGWWPVRARVRLWPEGALCMFGSGDDVRMLLREQFHVARTARTLLGAMVHVKLRVAERELAGSMSEAHFERFSRWKLSKQRGYERPAEAA